MSTKSSTAASRSQRWFFGATYCTNWSASYEDAGRRRHQRRRRPVSSGGQNQRPRRRPANTVVPSSEKTLLAPRRGRHPSVGRVAAVASWWSAAPLRRANRTANPRAERSTGRGTPTNRCTSAPADKPRRRHGIRAAPFLTPARLGRRWLTDAEARELGSGWNLGRREEGTGRGDKAGTKGTWPARGGGAAAAFD
jgi:hypothetical protein